MELVVEPILARQGLLVLHVLLANIKPHVRLMIIARLATAVLRLVKLGAEPMFVQPVPLALHVIPANLKHHV